jgi:hypothetical protein
MTTNIQLLRSSVAQKRPNPTSLLDGQPAVNINVSEPGLFFKATDGTLFKIGPVAITSGGNAPNSAASGTVGNLLGETWLDGRNSFANPVLKVFNGTQWVTGSGFQVDNQTGNFQLSKTLTVNTLIANGTGANAFIRVPSGPASDEQAITGGAGMIRFDTSTGQFRGFNGTTWSDIGSGNIVGNLNVNGNGNITGNLVVTGNTTLGNDCSVDSLIVNSLTTFNCGVTVGQNASQALTINSLTDFRSNVRISSQADLRFHSGLVTSSNFVGFQAPSSIAANVLWTLPNSDGASNQVLTTNGTGTLSWSTPASGGAKVTVSDFPPTSPVPDNGDLWYNSQEGRLFVNYQDINSNQWVDVSPVSAGVTNIKIIDDISTQFDGVQTAFNLFSGGVSITPVNAQQLLVLVNGQYRRASVDYTVSGSQILFSNPPTAGQTFYAIIYGAAVTQNTVADNAITTAKIQVGAVTASKLTIDGNIVPNQDNQYNLGSSTFRFANIYTGDLHLRNDRGDWTLVEESDYLTVRNNKTGKVYKLTMKEIK